MTKNYNDNNNKKLKMTQSNNKINSNQINNFNPSY